MAQQPDVHASADYSSTIYLYNKTSADFLLTDSKALLGSWETGSPANTIEAGQEAVLKLSDSAGMSNIST